MRTRRLKTRKMRTRRLKKHKMRTRRLKTRKMRIGRRTAIHKKSGGTNSSRKKFWNFLKGDETHKQESLIKKKLKNQDNLTIKEIEFFCNEKSPFKTDQRLNEKYTPLLDSNVRHIIDNYRFKFEMKEKEYNNLYKSLIENKITKEEKNILDEIDERKKKENKAYILLTEEEKNLLKKLEEIKKKNEDFILLTEEEKEILKFNKLELTEEEKNLLKKLEEIKKEKKKYEDFIFTDEEKNIFKLNKLDLEEEEENLLKKLDQEITAINNESIKYNKLYNNDNCIPKKSKPVSSSRREELNLIPPKSNLSINSAYFNADGRLHKPLPVPGPEPDLEPGYATLNPTNPLVPSNLNDGSNDNEEPIRPDTDSLVNRENIRLFEPKKI